jgi:hypothetical protein
MHAQYDYYWVVRNLLANGASPSVRTKEGVEARFGIEGDKVLPMVALGAVETTSELHEALDALLGSPEFQAKIDKAELVRTRMEVLSKHHNLHAFGPL